MKLIPVLTKIDLPASKPMEVAISVSDLFDFDPDRVMYTSARSRLGILDVSGAFFTNFSEGNNFLLRIYANSHFLLFHISWTDSKHCV